MTEQNADRATNPYRSPFPVDAEPSWWSRILGRHRAQRAIRRPNFFAGESIIHRGIAFWIDPGDSNTLFAGSPSSDLRDRRMNLVVAETIRVLPEFLFVYPEINETLVGRQLCVGLLNEYEVSPRHFLRERHLDWDFLSAILGDTETDHNQSTP